MFDRPPHVRQNFRGGDVIATGGVAVAAGLVVAWLVSLFARDAARVAHAMALAGMAMAVLGFVDDVYGDRRAGGLVGHARALLDGTITTGLVKAVGGAVIGLASAWIVGWRGVWFVFAGAVVALASNLVNLFDLRPGRAIKAWALAGVPLIFALEGSGRVVLVGVAASAAVFLVPELRERMMLGDTGAGLLGAVLGVAVVAFFGRVGIVLTAAGLLALTLASERVSFSRLIEAFPPLRWFDRLGRRP